MLRNPGAGWSSDAVEAGVAQVHHPPKLALKLRVFVIIDLIGFLGTFFWGDSCGRDVMETDGNIMMKYPPGLSNGASLST